MGVGREAKLWFDVDSGGGKDETCGGESGGKDASKTMQTHLKTWSPNGSSGVPHAHRGAGSVGKRGRRSFCLIAIVNSQLARQFEGMLRQRPMRG